MTMQRMTPVKMNRSQCARHISNGCTLLLFLEERTMNDASHLRYFGVQPLLFSTHSYSKHFSLDMWSCCFHIPFKNNYIWKITNQFKTLQNCLKTCRWDLSHCPLNGFDVTFTAILLKQISVKPSMSLAISAPMKTHLSVHYSPWVYSNPYNYGAKGELQMERDHKWELKA